jgi:hypothetical protein
MAAKDRLFAQFTMLNYLTGSRDRSVKEILSYLQENTEWGRKQLKAGAGDLGLRNVQNWLTDIRESPEFATQIEHREDPQNRRQFLYSSTTPKVGQRIMPVEEACLVLMAEKFLQEAIPADFYDAGLQDLFLAARARLKEYEKQPKQQRKRIKDYLKRIAIEQRGQTLIEKTVPYDVLGPLSRAILELSSKASASNAAIEAMNASCTPSPSCCAARRSTCWRLTIMSFARFGPPS